MNKPEKTREEIAAQLRAMARDWIGWITPETAQLLKDAADLLDPFGADTERT